MKVVTLYSTSLAPNVARDLNAELVKLSPDTFPDGEPHIHFGRKFENEEILFIQNTFPYQDKKLNEICFTICALKQQVGAKSVTAVVPYLAYMRQSYDFSQKRGIGYDAVCARVVLNNLKNCGMDKLYTIDAHSKEMLKDYANFAEDLDPSYLLAQHLAERELGKVLIVSPDDNAFAKGEKIASLLDVQHLCLEKSNRDMNGKFEIKELASSLPTENVVIIDDIIAEGLTVGKSSEILKKAGAKNILAACTHALMVRDAEKKLKTQGVSQVISTDSIESRTNYISPNYIDKISLSPLIAKLFKN